MDRARRQSDRCTVRRQRAARRVNRERGDVMLGPRRAARECPICLAGCLETLSVRCDQQQRFGLRRENVAVVLRIDYQGTNPVPRTTGQRRNRTAEGHPMENNILGLPNIEHVRIRYSREAATIRDRIAP